MRKQLTCPWASSRPPARRFALLGRLSLRLLPQLQSVPSSPGPHWRSAECFWFLFVNFGLGMYPRKQINFLGCQFICSLLPFFFLLMYFMLQIFLVVLTYDPSFLFDRA